MGDKFIDPANILPANLPLLVLSDHSSGFVEWAIKWRTKGGYNHIMWMHRPGYFASQGNVYSEAPLARYMKHGNTLKFIKVTGLSAVQRHMILASIQKKLKLPWWKRRYDFLGIIGQATGFKWINTPWSDYCSEDGPEHVRDNKLLINTMANEELKLALLNIPKHGSPEDLNRYFEAHPEAFETYGRWDTR